MVLLTSLVYKINILILKKINTSHLARWRSLTIGTAPFEFKPFSVLIDLVKYGCDLEFFKTFDSQTPGYYGQFCSS